MEYKGFSLDRFQEEAIKEIEKGNSIIVCAPTGAGKTLIAEYAIEKALSEGKAVIYTSPIKALSNQKFRDFQALYNEKVGILTGDVSFNPNAPLLIMTTEIFRNQLFESPERIANVSYLIIDEVHYISNEERGTVWEESIIFAPKHIQLICLSATIPNYRELAAWMESVRGQPVSVIVEHHRPVPLKNYLFLPTHGIITLKELKRIKPLKKLKSSKKKKNENFKYNIIKEVIKNKHLPCLVFSFNRAACESLAKKHSRKNFLTKEERKAALELFDSLSVRYMISGKKVKNMRELIKRGVAYHHAGLLPSLKEIVERLFTEGLIKLLFTTETFAMGINMPAAAVVFTTLEKYNGNNYYYMSVRDFQQMAGRSGRRGIDSVGHVYIQIDPLYFDVHEIGRILHSKPERVESQFALSYATILNLYKLIKEDVIEASRKSFYYFSHKENSYDIISQTKKRLDFLKEAGYIQNGELTTKGRFASMIYGYEIQITELFFNGVFENLEPYQINILISAVLFEPRRGDWYREIPVNIIKDMRREARRIIKRLRNIQRSLGIVELIPKLNFHFSFPVMAWSNGCEFSELQEYTTADEGDIIRLFRLMIQQIRALRNLVKEDIAFSQKLKICEEIINRGPVNAEKQLLASIGEEIGEEENISEDEKNINNGENNEKRFL